MQVVSVLLTKLQEQVAGATSCSGADGQLLDAQGSGTCVYIDAATHKVACI